MCVSQHLRVQMVERKRKKSTSSIHSEIVGVGDPT